MLENKLLIFKIVCLYLLCISFGMALLIIAALVKLFYLNGYDSILEPMPLISMLGFIIIGIFQSKCFNLIANKYPDKELTNKSDNSFSLLFIFSSVVFLAISFCFVAFIYAIFTDDAAEVKSSTVLYVLSAIFAIYIPCHVHCMRQSFALRKIIKINFVKLQNRIVNTIGEKSEVLDY